MRQFRNVVDHVRAFVQWLNRPTADTQIAELLLQMARIGEQAAKHLHESSCHDKQRIIEFEREADSVKEAVHALLDNTFQLRYFGKAEVQQLAKHLDNILDGMRDAVRHVAIWGKYFPKNDPLPEEAVQFLKIISGMTRVLPRLAEKLSSRHHDLPCIRQLVEELDQLESEADRILETAEVELVAEYASRNDYFAYSARDKLFRILEKITDSANHCGMQILSMARK